MGFQVGLVTNNSQKIIFIGQRYFVQKIKRKSLDFGP
jgi:hypothetical protein